MTELTVSKLTSTAASTMLLFVPEALASLVVVWWLLCAPPTPLGRILAQLAARVTHPPPLIPLRELGPARAASLAPVCGGLGRPPPRESCGAWHEAAPCQRIGAVTPARSHEGAAGVWIPRPAQTGGGGLESGPSDGPRRRRWFL